MRKDDCIFCRIANGNIPSNTLYEDDNFRVILDLSPATKGHALLLPKEHADNLYELSDAVAAQVMATVRNIAVRMKEKLHCDGINLVQNNGEAAGQTVNHFHMHIIPRYTGGTPMIEWPKEEPSPETLKNIRQQIVD